MKIEKINIDSDYIRLDSLIKYAGMVPTGGQAKYVIQNGMVIVDGEICTMRGKKIKPNSIVEYNKRIIEVSSD